MPRAGGSSWGKLTGQSSFQIIDSAARGPDPLRDQAYLATGASASISIMAQLEMLDDKHAGLVRLLIKELLLHRQTDANLDKITHGMGMLFQKGTPLPLAPLHKTSNSNLPASSSVTSLWTCMLATEECLRQKDTILIDHNLIARFSNGAATATPAVSARSPGI